MILRRAVAGFQVEPADPSRDVDRLGWPEQADLPDSCPALVNDEVNVRMRQLTGVTWQNQSTNGSALQTTRLRVGLAEQAPLERLHPAPM